MIPFVRDKEHNSSNYHDSRGNNIACNKHENTNISNKFSTNLYGRTASKT